MTSKVPGCSRLIENMENAIDFAQYIGEQLNEALFLARTLVIDKNSASPQAATSTAASKLTSKPTRILIALSGGCDSTALLAALHKVSEQNALDLIVCHVNHKLRGEEAERDESFCRELCRNLHRPLTVVHMDHALMDELPVPENDLRKARYKLLVEQARDNDCSFVAAAHTLNDQTETLLFRLFRGTAVSGLTGMSAARALDANLILLRPMLKISRQQCLQFLEQEQISFCEDSSNRDTRYARNFIRNELVARIDSRFSGFSQRLEQLRTVLAEENELLEQISAAELEGFEREGFARDRLLHLHTAIARRVVAGAMRQREVEVSFARVESVLSMWRAGAELAVSLNDVWDVLIDHNGDLLWRDKSSPKRFHLEKIAVKIPGLTIIAAADIALRVESLDRESDYCFPEARALTALVDLTRVTGTLVVRSREPGDLIQPFGMPHSVKLKKFLHTHKTEAAVPPLLLADEQDVLWVPGCGLSERLRASERPTHRLSLIGLSHDTTLA